MAPGPNKIAFPPSKGGHPQPNIEQTTHHQETIPTTVPTIKEMLTTIMNTVTETFVPSPGGADSNTNNMLPPEEGGANEMTNFNNTDTAQMNTSMTFSGNGISTSTGTSFEQVTTDMVDITSTLMDGMHMEHTDDPDEYNAVLFIVLGVVLGILIIVAVVLGVIYSHYRKRGFTEISGDQGQVDPQSMKQLQQASSQDALLDK